MSLQNRRFTAWLFAIALIAAQAVLVVHDTTPHASNHTDHCQICAHGAGLSAALPGLAIVFYPHAPDANPHAISVRQASLNRYHIPTARNPPFFSLPLNI